MGTAAAWWMRVECAVALGKVAHKRSFVGLGYGQAGAEP